MYQDGCLRIIDIDNIDNIDISVSHHQFNFKWLYIHTRVLKKILHDLKERFSHFKETFTQFLRKLYIIFWRISYNFCSTSSAMYTFDKC